MKEKKKHGIRLQPKLLIGLILVAAVLIITLTTTVVVLYRRQMEARYVKTAFDQATIAAHVIDGDSIKKYYTTGKKDEYYEKIRRYLLEVKKVVGLKYFYVVVPEKDHMVYIWDAGEFGESGVRKLLDTDNYYGGGDKIMHEAFRGGRKHHVLITNNEEYGYLASAYVPILNSASKPVALASVDMSMNQITDTINEFVRLIAWISLALLTFSVLVTYFYIRRTVIRPVRILNDTTTELVKNEMDHLNGFHIPLKTGDEFEELAGSFEHMTEELQEYITNLQTVTAERERIGAELDVAKQIQSSMLPCIFPAFPERKEFDIYATMDPAKEVGGDFYDFFMVDDRHLAIVIADVSGKGVPAALFMVIGKTLIKDHTVPARALGDVFSRVNNLLCEANSEGLFITAFEGVLDLVSGDFCFVNAGHELPFIAKKGEPYSVKKIRPGFVLAGMEGMKYTAGSMKLEPGDKLFQYTDGVTEATNSGKELYGMKRLEECLNRNRDLGPMELLPKIKEDIDLFVGEAEQFDDITMLCLEYKTRMGGAPMKELMLDATLENIPRVTEFVEEQLAEYNCPVKAQMQIAIAIDELFSNIAHYAYNPDVGPATVRVEVQEDPMAVIITFIDHGVPYDPLAKEDPNVHLSLEEREVGGLGIYMVKKTMDEISYEYKNGHNILTIKKTLK